MTKAETRAWQELARAAKKLRLAQQRAATRKSRKREGVPLGQR